MMRSGILKRRGLVWRLYPTYLLVLVPALVAIGVYSSGLVRQSYLEEKAQDLESRARLVGLLLAGADLSDVAAVTSVCEEAGAETGARLTVIGPGGSVIGDSDQDPAGMQNHGSRPEVAAALTGRVGRATRHSDTLGEDMMYVAVPLAREGSTAAVIRAAVPLTSISPVIGSIRNRIALVGVIVAALAAVISLLLARSIGRSAAQMVGGARRFASGDLGHRLPVPDSEELGALAESMNAMAAQLEERIDRLRGLERVRRDFVANVSHELKTPITSIKGFVETLRDGAINDPADAARFLEIVSRHTERLDAIIEDLLSLSRLEQDKDAGGIAMERCGVADVIGAATGVCSVKAADKGIRIVVSCDRGLEASMNPALIEQAIVNLVDNAIKYTSEGGRIDVSARLDDAHVIIEVVDNGCGIARQHLDRIFERFYRVDKARSRDQGGTGLGLAIVKHIAMVHGGKVSVESTPGSGSTFRLTLPAN